MAGPENKKERDELSGVETTGHEWDGLKELNNPAPRWWLWVFIITVVWSVGYWVLFPAWPTLSGHTKGSWGWTQYARLNEHQEEIRVRQKTYIERMEGLTMEEVVADDELYQFAVAGGAVAFKNHCAACHGTGAAGGNGYPNLNDDDWLWGGKLSDIYHTLVVGIRAAHPETRSNIMPAFGRDGILKRDEINDLAAYVASLSDPDPSSEDEAFLVREGLFLKHCASCHGEQGEGNRELGAPRLSDAIWLYGGDKNSLVETITNSRAGMMPNWEGRLSDTTLRMLAIYVHSLGGGEASAPLPTPQP